MNVSSSLTQDMDLEKILDSLNNTLGNYLNIFKTFNNQMIETTSNDQVWIADCKSNNTFVRLSKCDVIERIKGLDVYEFRAIMYDYNTGGLLLFDHSRNIYVQIDKYEAKSGDNLNNLNHLYYGKWKELDSTKDLSIYFQSLNECEQGYLLKKN